MTAGRSEVAQNALMLVADWHWRKGPRRKAALAWLFGRRERFRTHLGDHVKIAWWRGSPYLNLNHYELNAEAFGVRFTGDEADATENATRLQGALDWLYAEGQGGRITLASEGHVTGTAPIAGRSARASGTPRSALVPL